MMTRARFVGGLSVLLAMLLMCSCRMPGEQQNFSKLTEEFVYSSLALSPAAATSAGYHQHHGQSLDDKLDDFSRASLQDQGRFYLNFQRKLEVVQRETLSVEDQADYDIIQNQISLGTLELHGIQSFRHNPTVYVELIGNALFNPYMLEYAPKPLRYRSIIKRLARVPILLEQAREQLADSPTVWNRVAQEENAGNIDLVDKTLREAAPAELRPEYDKAAKPALDALRQFNDYLKNTLAARTASWRLGQRRYAQKFQATLTSGKTPNEVLQEAEAALKTVQGEMAQLSAPKSVREALNAISAHHATPETYFDEARHDLATATEFVRTKHLLTLPAQSKLEVIPTPEFMRGGYGVGGFNPAPPLEPQLGSFYWITPIPKDWPKERVESKLREYNVYGLQELTIHEAVPGHYVQAEYANAVQPEARRLLRAVYANVPYVEGWAVYAQQIMSDEGYLSGSRELRLVYLKWLLRSIANAILDIRLQTMEMSDQEALDLMINETYQEKEEAAAKLQRAQLSSCQLPTYFVGWRGWLDVREQYRKKKGSAFQLADFHERALKEGAVPLPLLSRLLTN